MNDARPARHSWWKHPADPAPFIVTRADRGEHAYVYLVRRDIDGRPLRNHRIPTRDWPGDWQPATDAEARAWHRARERDAGRSGEKGSGA